MSGSALPDVLLLALLLGVLPVVSVVQLRYLEAVDIEPLPVYLSSAVTLVILGGASLAVGARQGGLAAVGMVSLAPGPLVAWAGGLTFAGLALLLLFRALGGAVGASETRILRLLLPRTRAERAAFTGLSLAAGAGEEMAYRGYAIPVLAAWMGPLAAAALTSVVFGLLHGYQGRLGVVRTTALGGLLAWGFLGSGSLWPPILAHAALDVLAGTLLADRLMVPAAPGGVDPERKTPSSAS